MVEGHQIIFLHTLRALAGSIVSSLTDGHYVPGAAKPLYPVRQAARQESGGLQDMNAISPCLREEIGQGIKEAWHNIFSIQRITHLQCLHRLVLPRQPDIYFLALRPDDPDKAHT